MSDYKFASVISLHEGIALIPCLQLDLWNFKRFHVDMVKNPSTLLGDGSCAEVVMRVFNGTSKSLTHTQVVHTVWNTAPFVLMLGGRSRQIAASLNRLVTDGYITKKGLGKTLTYKRIEK